MGRHCCINVPSLWGVNLLALVSVFRPRCGQWIILQSHARLLYLVERMASYMPVISNIGGMSVWNRGTVRILQYKRMWIGSTTYSLYLNDVVTHYLSVLRSA